MSTLKNVHPGGQIMYHHKLKNNKEDYYVNKETTRQMLTGIGIKLNNSKSIILEDPGQMTSPGILKARS